MTWNTNDTAMADYAEELRVFLMPPATRGGPASVDAVTEQADALAALSTRAISQAASYLEADDASLRLGAEQHLLAQAAASLQVADRLLAAAVEAGEIEPAEMTRAAAPPSVDLGEMLAILQTPMSEVGDTVRAVRPAARGARSVTSGADLTEAADSVLTELLDSATSQSRDAFAGLLGLDVALIKRAAGLISGELEAVLEQLGEAASRLVARAVTFLVQAYESLLAALGQDATSALRQQASAWLERLEEGEAMTALLGTLFQVGETRQQIRALVAAGEIADDRLPEVVAAVTALPAGYRQRTRLANQLLAGMGLVRRFPAARVPMAELAAAAVYLLTMGFFIFVGGDYVDAPRLERLGRVPGVLHVIQEGVAT